MLAFLLAQATALSFLQLRTMSPADAGDAVLRDEPHGRIVAFEAPTGGLNLPGVVDGEFVEQPAPRGPGCVRRRWTVTFHTTPGADIGTATPQDKRSAWEIAPSADGACPSGRYAHLNPGVSVNQGWEALARLKAVTAEAGPGTFQCSDATSSGLCKDSPAIRAALRGLTPWAITQEAGATIIWLGVPGQVVTEVRWQAADPDQLRVTRKVPAPF